MPILLCISQCQSDIQTKKVPAAATTQTRRQSPELSPQITAHCGPHAVFVLASRAIARGTLEVLIHPTTTGSPKVCKRVAYVKPIQGAQTGHDFSYFWGPATHLRCRPVDDRLQLLRSEAGSCLGSGLRARTASEMTTHPPPM